MLQQKWDENLYEINDRGSHWAKTFSNFGYSSKEGN